eukprot:1160685-Rhodomonas_salina.3
MCRQECRRTYCTECQDIARESSTESLRECLCAAPAGCQLSTRSEAPLLVSHGKHIASRVYVHHIVSRVHVHHIVSRVHVSHCFPRPRHLTSTSSIPRPRQTTSLLAVHALEPQRCDDKERGQEQVSIGCGCFKHEHVGVGGKGQDVAMDGRKLTRSGGK